MKIVSWWLCIEWDNGKKQQIADVPDDVAQPIDDYLTELEGEQDE